jgi:hypothetical protein
MQLLKFDPSKLAERGRVSVTACLQRWDLKAYHEEGSDSAPLLLVYESTPDVVENIWLKLVSDIALSIQAELGSEFARRNLALVLISRGRLPRSVLKAIRDNTYCCKKIVIESKKDYKEVLDAYYLNAYTIDPQEEQVGPDGTLEKDLLMKYSLLKSILEN